MTSINPYPDLTAFIIDDVAFDGTPESHAKMVARQLEGAYDGEVGKTIYLQKRFLDVDRIITQVDQMRARGDASPVVVNMSFTDSGLIFDDVAQSLRSVLEEGSTEGEYTIYNRKTQETVTVTEEELRDFANNKVVSENVRKSIIAGLETYGPTGGHILMIRELQKLADYAKKDPFGFALVGGAGNSPDNFDYKALVTEIYTISATDNPILESKNIVGVPYGHARNSMIDAFVPSHDANMGYRSWNATSGAAPTWAGNAIGRHFFDDYEAYEWRENAELIFGHERSPLYDKGASYSPDDYMIEDVNSLSGETTTVYMTNKHTGEVVFTASKIDEDGWVFDLLEDNTVYKSLDYRTIEVEGLTEGDFDLSDLPEEDVNKFFQDLIEKAPDMKKLSLSGIDRLPASVGEMHNLKTLDILGTNISELPDSIGNLSQLEELDISYTTISELPDSIGQLSQLKTLYLGGTTISELPDSIGQLSQLEELHINDTDMERLPDSASGLTNLTRFNANDSKISELTPEILQGWSKLGTLQLENTQIQALPEELYQLSELKSLNITGTQISELSPKIGQLDKLYWVRMENTPITSLPMEFASLPDLTALFISGSKIPPDDPVLQALNDRSGVTVLV